MDRPEYFRMKNNGMAKHPRTSFGPLWKQNKTRLEILELLRKLTQRTSMHITSVTVRHCGPVDSAPAWDGTGCEFDSWQCRIYISCSLSLRLLGSLRGSPGTYGLTQKLCKKTKQNMKFHVCTVVPMYGLVFIYSISITPNSILKNRESYEADE